MLMREGCLLSATCAGCGPAQLLLPRLRVDVCWRHPHLLTSLSRSTSFMSPKKACMQHTQHRHGHHQQARCQLHAGGTRCACEQRHVKLTLLLGQGIARLAS